jgi:hypothetical protein
LVKGPLPSQLSEARKKISFLTRSKEALFSLLLSAPLTGSNSTKNVTDSNPALKTVLIFMFNKSLKNTIQAYDNIILATW